MSEPRVVTPGQSLRAIPLAIGFAVALILGFVLCVVAALALPELPLAHGWVALFTAQPIGSARNWIEGIVGSTFFGLLIGFVTAIVYNLLANVKR